MIVNSQQIGKDWIKVSDGKFKCSECDNTDFILTNTLGGIEPADLAKITEDLKNFPTKVIYGICTVCGMEYVFHLVDNDLWLEPSKEQK